jgi:single-stranded-DNA-specific exonuclease
VQGLDLLAPCGSGNPSPRFLVRGAAIGGVYPVSEGRHCRLRLCQGGHSLYAVLFGCGPEKLAYRSGDEVDVLVGLSVYDGKQGPQVSARIIELRPAGMGNEHVAQSALFTSFYAGGSPHENELELLAPTRDDTAAVYRHIRDAGGISAGDLRPAFRLLGESRSGRVLTAVAALQELELIERDPVTERLRCARVQGKKDLSASPLLQRLSQARG